MRGDFYWLPNITKGKVLLLLCISTSIIWVYFKYIWSVCYDINLIKPLKEDNIFQKLPVFNVYVYSAYWDDRQSQHGSLFGRQSNIRIIGAVTNNYNPYLVCVFKAGCSWKTSPLTYKEVLDTHGLEYFGYVMSCSVPYGIEYHPDMSILISASSYFMDSSVRVKVKPAHIKTQILNYAICVPPLYGNIKLQRLIEFIELSRILGAEKIIFYATRELSTEASQLIKKYQSTDENIEMYQWHLPNYISKLNEKLWYNGQDLTVQDCMYKNMASVKYIAFNDIDEFIIPRQYENIFSLLSYFESPFVSNFCFVNAFFQCADKSLPVDLPVTMRYTNRSKVYIKERSKCIVKPELVFDMGTHDINRHFSFGNKQICILPEVAVLHHYRITEEDNTCTDTVTDQSALRYANELKARLKPKIKFLT